jgi:transcriptional regulator with XRE-family HTH domain
MTPLRQARENAKLSLADVARRTGFSQMLLRHFEDDTATPTAEELDVLGSVYGCFPSLLLELKGQ